jgi:hypothetical protein
MMLRTVISLTNHPRTMPMRMMTMKTMDHEQNSSIAICLCLSNEELNGHLIMMAHSCLQNKPGCT